MDNRFERAVIHHCAATLAGHKCGSLFSLRGVPQEACRQSAQALDALLEHRGVRVRLLKTCAKGCKVYVYRPAMLEDRLAQPPVRAFLTRLGYDAHSREACLAELGRRICCGAPFPHEIGVFLDYPLEDVIGFIEHGGRRFSCEGCWKAYGDAEAARRRFELYGKCRRVYASCYQRGFDVVRLTVAA